MDDEKTGLVGLRDAARQVGVKPWHISYALAAGYIQEPLRVAGKRAFDPEAIRQMRRHFGRPSEAAVEGPLQGRD